MEEKEDDEKPISQEDELDQEENDLLDESFDMDEQKVGLITYLKSESEFQSDHGRRCKFFLDMPPLSRMRQIIAWADEKGIPRQGDSMQHNDYCTKCGNGEGATGLLLCDFCENVIHRECLGFETISDDFDFSCDE